MKQSPIYQTYARVAPSLADWPVRFTKLGELLSKDYDWSKDVAAIKAPTLLVVADADAVRTAHTVKSLSCWVGQEGPAGMVRDVQWPPGYSAGGDALQHSRDRKSTRLNSSHVKISYAVFC